MNIYKKNRYLQILRLFIVMKYAKYFKLTQWILKLFVPN